MSSVVPFTVVPNVISPAPAPVDSATLPASTVDVPMLRSVFVVVILAPRLTSPLVLNPPTPEISAPVATVKVPLLVTAIAPLAPNVLFTAKATPFNAADPTLTVELNVVVPVAALVCVSAPERVTAPVNPKVPEFVTVRDPAVKELEKPTAPPVPPFTVNALTPV